MPEYKVGTLTNADLSTGLILQDITANIEFDTSEVKDENGNVAYVQHYNHRAVLSCNAIAPKGTALPTVGATVSLKGITLPSVAADGKMTSASVTLSEDGAGGSAVEFLVTSASIATSNSDVPKYALTLTRYLENSFGAIKTSPTA